MVLMIINCVLWIFFMSYFRFSNMKKKNHWEYLIIDHKYDTLDMLNILKIFPYHVLFMSDNITRHNKHLRAASSTAI